MAAAVSDAFKKQRGDSSQSLVLATSGTPAPTKKAGLSSLSKLGSDMLSLIVSNLDARTQVAVLRCDKFLNTIVGPKVSMFCHIKAEGIPPDFNNRVRSLFLPGPMTPAALTKIAAQMNTRFQDVRALHFKDPANVGDASSRRALLDSCPKLQEAHSLIEHIRHDEGGDSVTLDGYPTSTSILGMLQFGQFLHPHVVLGPLASPTALRCNFLVTDAELVDLRARFPVLRSFTIDAPLDRRNTQRVLTEDGVIAFISPHPGLKHLAIPFLTVKLARAIRTHCPGLETLVINYSWGRLGDGLPTDGEVNALFETPFPSLTTLVLNCLHPLQLETIERVFRHAPNLEAVKIMDRRSNTLRKIEHYQLLAAHCRRLRFLDLSGIWNGPFFTPEKDANEAFFEVMQCLPDIEYLDLSNSETDDHLLPHFGYHFPHLRLLSLHGLENVHSGSFEKLAKYTKGLEFLNIYSHKNAWMVRPETIRKLFPKIRHIETDFHSNGFPADILQACNFKSLLQNR